MQTQITLPTEKISEFCQRHPIHRLAVFGSALRGDLRPDSDIDLLVEFDPEARVGFFELVRMQDQLAEIIGRPVDLNTPMSLSRHFRAKVIKLAEVLYERAG